MVKCQVAPRGFCPTEIADTAITGYDGCSVDLFSGERTKEARPSPHGVFRSLLALGLSVFVGVSVNAVDVLLVPLSLRKPIADPAPRPQRCPVACLGELVGRLQDSASHALTFAGYGEGAKAINAAPANTPPAIQEFGNRLDGAAQHALRRGRSLAARKKALRLSTRFALRRLPRIESLVTTLLAFRAAIYLVAHATRKEGVKRLDNTTGAAQFHTLAPCSKPSDRRTAREPRDSFSVRLITPNLDGHLHYTFSHNFRYSEAC